MVFITAFNNISVTSWWSGLWCLSPLSTIFLLHRGGQVYGIYHRFQQYFCYIVVVRFMVFITAFNNISVTSWWSGLWYLSPLSTIFLLHRGGQVYGVYHRFQQYFCYIVVVRFMVFITAFNNISVTSWGSGSWCLSPLSTIFLLHRGGQVYGIYHRFQQYFCYIVVVRFMVFITAFNNISVTSWGSGLWCLSPLSTIFLLHRGGQVHGVYHRFQQYFCYIVVVRFMVFTTAFNNISVTSWGSVLWCLPPLSTIFLLHRGGQVYGIYHRFQQYFCYIVGVRFNGGEHRRKPPTCCKSLINFIT